MIRNSKGYRKSIPGMGKHKRIQPIDLKHEVILLRAGNENASEKIITGHIGLAGSIAARYAYVVHRDPNELLSVAMLGLVEAVDRIKGGACPHDNYGAYIQTCVNGRVSNFLSTDYIVKPPNGEPNYEKLKNAGKGMNPTHFAGSTFFLTNEEKVHEAMRQAESEACLLAELMDSTHFTFKEKQILRLSYEGYTNEEIGRIVQHSRSRIQQLKIDLLILVKNWLRS